MHVTVDPAPAVDASKSIDELSVDLKDVRLSLFDRYRAMFALRDKANGDAVRALCELFSDSSALLKHELAFVLGQMALPEAIAPLSVVLRDRNEHIMVRAVACRAARVVSHTRVGRCDMKLRKRLVRALVTR
jgi:deoxyhypusine monooxygenase